MTSGEETSCSYKNICSIYYLKKQKIILQIQRCSIPSKQIGDQGRETSLKRPCCFDPGGLDLLGHSWHLESQDSNITETTVLRLVLLSSSCTSARNMRVYATVKYTVWDWRRQNVEEIIELEITFVLFKTVKGRDHLEQVSNLCQHYNIQPLIPLELYKSVNMCL